MMNPAYRRLSLVLLFLMSLAHLHAVERRWVGPANGEFSEGQFWEPPNAQFIEGQTVYFPPDEDDILTVPDGSIVAVRRGALGSRVKILPGAEVTVSGILYGTIENRGRLVFPALSRSDFGLGFRLENLEEGLVDIGNHPFNSTSPTAVINRGHIRYTGSEDLEFSGHHTYVFENYGLVETTDGKISFSQNVNPNDGTTNIALISGRWRSGKSGTRFSFMNATLSNPIVEGPGEMMFYQGVVNLNGSNVSTNMVVDGSQLKGTNSFKGILTIRSSPEISGQLHVPAGSELRFQGPGVYPSAQLFGHLINEGVVTIPEQTLPAGIVPLEILNGGFENRASGTLEIRYPQFAATMTNFGTIRYSGRTPWQAFGSVIQNHGLIESLYAGIRNGTFELFPSSRLKAPLLEEFVTVPWMFTEGGEFGALNGRIEAQLFPGLRPTPGQRFAMIGTALPPDSIHYTGRFVNQRTEVADGLYFTINYLPTKVELVTKTAPVADADAVELLANSATNVAVLANDTDADGDLLTVASFTQGTRGSVSANADGTLRYTPALGYVGPDSFTYTVADAFEVTSTATVTVTVLPVPPLFTQQPANQTVAPGATATFTAAATGVPVPALQWHFAEAPLPGQTGGTLTLTGASAANEGLYFVVASNAAGSITSAPARLRLMPVPRIVTSPVSRVVGPGTEVVLSVSATSESGLSFQWRFNGENLPGATGDSFTLPAAEAANVGRYTVVVSNQAGSLVSAPATLSLFDVATFVGTIISGPVGASYRVESREALDPLAAWQPAATVTLTESPTVWIDRNSPKETLRFYRASLLNP
jgi:hypothetical protein